MACGSFNFNCSATHAWSVCSEQPRFPPLRTDSSCVLLTTRIIFRTSGASLGSMRAYAGADTSIGQFLDLEVLRKLALAHVGLDGNGLILPFRLLAVPTNIVLRPTYQAPPALRLPPGGRLPTYTPQRGITQLRVL